MTDFADRTIDTARITRRRLDMVLDGDIDDRFGNRLSEDCPGEFIIPGQITP